MNRPEELIKKIYEEQGQIKDVFFTEIWMGIQSTLLL